MGVQWLDIKVEFFNQETHWVPNLHHHMHLSVKWGWLRPGSILRQPQVLPLCTAYPFSSVVSTVLLFVCLPREWKLAQNLISHSSLPRYDYFPIVNKSTSPHLWLWLCCMGVSGQQGVWSGRWLESHERNRLLSQKSLTSMAINEELQVSALTLIIQYSKFFVCVEGGAASTFHFCFSIPLYYYRFWWCIDLWREGKCR